MGDSSPNANYQKISFKEKFQYFFFSPVWYFLLSKVFRDGCLNSVQKESKENV